MFEKFGMTNRSFNNNDSFSGKNSEKDDENVSLCK